MAFPKYLQPDAKDCGPACLKIISKYYDKVIAISHLRTICESTRQGTGMANLVEAAEKIGFRTIGVKIDMEMLRDKSPFPCIVFWRNNHYVVVYKIKGNKVFTSDPAHGLIKYTTTEFLEAWIGRTATENTKEGIAILLEPTPRFYNYQAEFEAPKMGRFRFLFDYILPYRTLFIQLIAGLIFGSVLQLAIPFLFQAVVDIGVSNKDIGLVYLILIGQLMLFLGRISIDAIRGWILLHLSSRINISLISDFFIKLMNLPIRFFDSKLTGDLLQRIYDHKKIEQFLTTTSLNTLFSFLNVLTFGVVLIYYNYIIFLIYSIGAVLYVSWVLFFLRKRRTLNYKQFTYSVEENGKILEIVNGMQEIKLHNSEKAKRWEWEFIQARLFKVSLRNLSLLQKQNIGSSFINELVNILITIVAATLVISDSITLGMMISIQYIVGQLNGPLSQFVSFITSAQDAKLSLERLEEIHLKENETNDLQIQVKDLDVYQDITVEHLTFRYSSANEPVLQNLSLTIPCHKTTAIVGPSGSGKTTLMKMLLKFYEPSAGDIKVGNINLSSIAQSFWRNQCGVVMQDGFIFNDTIARNIAIGALEIDNEKLYNAADLANILPLIESLPLGFNTKVGQDGIGLSSGEKQRILIARVIYKSPKIIFFDEATSSLDANNEKLIVNNLDRFLENRTAIIIAHRLSTVKNADQIVVLNDGAIAEVGSHAELLLKQGIYFHLVKNQLALEEVGPLSASKL